MIFNLLYMALIGVHLYWHIWMNPLTLPLLVVSTLPLLVPLPWLLMRPGHRVRSAVSLLTLLYFVYAMMESVAVPELRLVAVTQVGLCVLLYVSLILSKHQGTTSA
ncbi:MAG: DUF2069 domain-containing protein [Xanthomonadales bacterium]|nr:DUF2069 domain-containing protein [Xanthomonadales bacterium]